MNISEIESFVFIAYSNNCEKRGEREREREKEGIGMHIIIINKRFVVQIISMFANERFSFIPLFHAV